MTASVRALTSEIYRELTMERRRLAERELEMLEAQIAIASIPAPTGVEARRAAWIDARFRELGLEARVDEAGNVIARTPAARAAPVVVCAHLDTVFPAETPLAMRRDGPRVTGPGICDNGRGLAAMLEIARAHVSEGPSGAGRIEFVATTGEEGAGDLRGAKHYFAQRESPFAVIVLDGAGDDRIVNTALGSRRFHVSFHGPGGHSWAAYGIVNPVHAAARAAAMLADLPTPRGSRSALSVSRIGGGLAINAIAGDAWLEVDARSTGDAVLDRLEREIRFVVESVVADENGRRAPTTPALTYHVDRIGHRPGGATSPDHPLVTAAIEATRLVGREPSLSLASTDANAAIAAGIPAIAIGGGGRGGDAHSSREWFDATAAVVGVERALTIVATMARLAAD